MKISELVDKSGTREALEATEHFRTAHHFQIQNQIKIGLSVVQTSKYKVKQRN